MTGAPTHEGRLVDLIDTAGLLVYELELPSHAAMAQFSIDGREMEARAYALDQTTALFVAPQLSGCGADDDCVTLALQGLRSAGRTSRGLRTRLAALMALPEGTLAGWDERQIRHALLYVLEAAEGSIRDERLVALEGALGARTTL